MPFGVFCYFVTASTTDVNFSVACELSQPMGKTEFSSSAKTRTNSVSQVKKNFHFTQSYDDNYSKEQKYGTANLKHRKYVHLLKFPVDKSGIYTIPFPPENRKVNLLQIVSQFRYVVFQEFCLFINLSFIKPNHTHSSCIFCRDCMLLLIFFILLPRTVLKKIILNLIMRKIFLRHEQGPSSESHNDISTSSLCLFLCM